MTIKIPDAYARQPVIHFQEVSKGERPAIDCERPATWLPVIQQSARQGEWHVVLAGTIVAREVTTGNLLVPANGGAAQNVTYTVNDVGYTYNYANTTQLVTAAGVAGQYPANLPMGWCFYHWFSQSMITRFTNYSLQPNVATLNDYVIEIPLIWTHQTTGANALINGCLVRPDGTAVWAQNGSPIRWINGVDSVEQIAGRVLKVEDITVVDNLDKVRTVRGLGLSGDGTSGIEHWLSATHQNGSTADHKAIIAIDLM